MFRVIPCCTCSGPGQAPRALGGWAIALPLPLHLELLPAGVGRACVALWQSSAPSLMVWAWLWGRALPAAFERPRPPWSQSTSACSPSCLLLPAALSPRTGAPAFCPMDSAVCGKRVQWLWGLASDQSFFPFMISLPRLPQLLKDDSSPINLFLSTLCPSPWQETI